MSEIKGEINLNVIERPPTHADVVSGKESKPIVTQPISSNEPLLGENEDKSERNKDNEQKKSLRMRCEDCLVDCGTVVCIDCCLDCVIIGCVGTCTQSLCKGCDLGA